MCRCTPCHRHPTPRHYGRESFASTSLPLFLMVKPFWLTKSTVIGSDISVNEIMSHTTLLAEALPAEVSVSLMAHLKVSKLSTAECGAAWVAKSECCQFYYQNRQCEQQKRSAGHFG